MGRVYLANDTALDRDVAIKVLNQQRTADVGIVSRFMNEAKSAARLNHEHIAQVYFAGETAGMPFIVFEYVEGTNVRAMVEENDVFPLTQALNYLIQIAHALAHAATHGVIHRDVKPSNIIITRSGRAKLIDMGLARLLDTAEGRGDLTASGVTLGTFDYISPEQARDPRNADIRSDIYSLGCTFFFMLVGRPPFPEGTVLQKLLQHQGDAPPDIRSFQPSIPAEVAFIMQKMMAKDPKQRFQTPAVLIEALTGVAQRLGLRQTEKDHLTWSAVHSHRQKIRRNLPWIVSISLLLVGFALLALFSDTTLHLPPENESAQQAEQIFQAVPSPSVEVPVASVEPVSSSGSSFAFAFVPHTPQSAGLGPTLPGGSLRPAVEGGGLVNSLHGTSITVADMRPTSPGGTAPQAARPSNIRYVDPMDSTIGSYPSLSSALNGASDGTVIKLKWNHIHRVTEPIRLDQRKLQFVAAEGYAPILFFEPSELQSARSFFTVFSSEIDFQNVGIEMSLNPNIPSLHWSLFELAGDTELAFSQCFLTVRNKSRFDDSANHDNVVFFRNGIPAGGAEAIHNVETPLSEPLSLTISNSLLRGEAVVLQSDVPQDVQMQVTNSIIASAKPFLQVEESRRAIQPTMIRLEWDRVVFFGRQGFALLFKELTTGPIVVDFESRHSVFVLNRSPFAFFRGIRSQQRALDEFQWSAGLNNYFQDVSGLRFRTSPSVLDAGTTYDIALEDWREDWTEAMREQIKIGALVLNEINKPVSRYLPQDVRLLYALEPVLLPDFDWFPVWWHIE